MSNSSSPSDKSRFKDLAPIDLTSGNSSPSFEDVVKDIVDDNEGTEIIDGHGHGHQVQVSIDPPPSEDRVQLSEEVFGRQPFVTVREYFDQRSNNVVHVVRAGGGISQDPKDLANLFDFLANVLRNEIPQEGSLNG